MPLTYTDEQRRAYLAFTDQLGAGWMKLFSGDTEFYSSAYWDLFTYLWRRHDPVRKTDALSAITGVKSPLTASKYVEIALAHGLILEKPNPKDARSKLIALSLPFRAQLDAFFDDAVDKMRRAAVDIAS